MLESRLGVDFGTHLMPAAIDNPVGFYENEKIVALNDEILSGGPLSMTES